MSACEHCLRRVGEREVVRDAVDGVEHTFCCRGCAGVFRLIHAEGLRSFYDRRQGWVTPDAALGEIRAPSAEAFEELVQDRNGHRVIELYIDGIRCASCVWLNERLLRRTPGVVTARVNYATHRARVEWDPSLLSLEGLLRRVASAGYQPKPFGETERRAAQAAESRDLLIRLGTAAFLSSQLMIYSAALYAGYFQGIAAHTQRLFEVIAALLTLPVLAYAGAPFYANTLTGLRHGRFTMDALIAIGASAAYVFSLHAIWVHGQVYFDTAAMIVTLILLGRYIEARARGRASETLERLAALVARKARRLRSGEGGDIERESIPIRLVRPGDRLEVIPGERIPLDGRVVEGRSEVDESMVTGESRPLLKEPGSPVIGGTLNTGGALVVEVTHAGDDTVLAGIRRSIEEAQTHRPRAQILAESVVGLFVPAILVLAAATTSVLLWRGEPTADALMRGVAVLVIACPCSLGLATPIAVLVATGVTSARGLLVKSGDLFERAGLVSQVLYDKTGTLTMGAHELRHVRAGGADAASDEMLRLAASVEQSSEHSIGRALVRAWRDRGGAPLSPVTGFQVEPGRGVSALLAGERHRVGNSAWLAECEVGPTPALTEWARECERLGDTVVFLTKGDHVLAAFAFSDTPRPEAREVVARHVELGLPVGMVTGDHPETARVIAAQIGVERIEAGVSPRGKSEHVRALQERGERVLLVGDGINDAPALSEAYVGAAMGRGTDVAQASAQLVLLRDDLRLVPFYLDYAKRARRIIGQNIFWAFAYNLAAIPLAVAGVLHPIVAAAAMATSSLFVVGNSLRLRRV